MGLHCCTSTFSSCSMWGLLSSCGAQASHYSAFSCCGGRAVSTGSVVGAHGVSCSAACGIFLDEGSNLYLLHWQADSLSQIHLGSPSLAFLIDSLFFLAYSFHHQDYLFFYYCSLSGITFLVVSFKGPCFSGNMCLSVTPRRPQPRLLSTQASLVSPVISGPSQLFSLVSITFHRHFFWCL